ncbi:MAG: extracellular solute-binding protein [Chloroflexi bacterium]|nr:extracellular solute-binding protein [Chloroflexota bacterium]
MRESNRLAGQMRRRRGLFAAAGVAALGVAGGAVACGDAARTSIGGGGKRPFEGRALTIFVYAGIWEKWYRELFAPAFEAETGAKVIIDAGWWDALPKLKLAPPDQPPFDLMLTDPTQGFPAIRDGLAAKLNLANIPNAKQFAPKVLDTWIYKDGWGIPHISSPMTLAWHQELLPDGLRDWGELLEPPARGRFTVYSSYYMGLFTFAAIKAAREGRAGQAHRMIQDDLDGVLNYAREHRDAVRYWWSATTDAVQALLGKNVAAGALHGNGLLAPVRDNKPLAFTIPAKDRAYVQLFFLVTKGSKNKDVAEAALDYIAGSTFQWNLASKSGELAAHIPAAAEQIGARDRLWGRIYPSTAADWAAMTYYPYEFYDRYDKKIADFWNREVLRKP